MLIYLIRLIDISARLERISEGRHDLNNTVGHQRENCYQAQVMLILCPEEDDKKGKE